MLNADRVAWIAGLCLTTFYATSFANAQNEIPCPGAYAHDHQAILEHAALAELTYAKPQRDPYEISIYRYCSAPHRQQDSEGQRTVEVREIPDYVIDVAAKRITNHYEEKEQKIAIVQLQNNGDTLYACERNLTLFQRLAIGFKWMQLGDRLALSYTFGVVVGVAGTALGGNEEIKLIELRRPTPSGKPTYEELVLGVQGTDPTRLRLWVSSVQRMIGDSCTFGFAREVTRSFFEKHDVDFENRRAALVGHSLGGAVVQHIGDTMPLSGIAQGRQDVSNLLGYSFNSFGIPGDLRHGTHHKDVHSIVVAGEVLEQLVTGTTQIGYQYRYDPAASPIQRWTQQLYRHKISTVQQKVCGCLDGGGLTYQFAAP